MTEAVSRRAAASSAREIGALCGAAALVAGAAAAFGLHAGADPAEGWQLAARYTARTSFLIFLPVYVASAWHRLAPSAASRAWLRRRRAGGLAFATAHTVHLASLLAANVAAGRVPDAPTLVVGGGAYLTMFAMAATSNDAAVRLLGRGWRRLHAFGIHYLWFVFTFSYAGRTFGGHAGFAPLFLLAVAGLGLRLAAARVRRARRTAPARREAAGEV